MKRLSSSFALTAVAIAAAALQFGTASAQNVAPLPSASPIAPSPAAAKPKATPAPPKDPEDNRVGLTGVWEIALQKTDGVVYTHFKITQTGNAISGQYLDEAGKKFPLAGSVDGKKVRVVVTMADGTALVFTGASEGNTDMVGTLSTAKDLLGFTAAYRPKYKWIDNISPGGSGLGGLGGNPGGNPQR